MIRLFIIDVLNILLVLLLLIQESLQVLESTDALRKYNLKIEAVSTVSSCIDIKRKFAGWKGRVVNQNNLLYTKLMIIYSLQYCLCTAKKVSRFLDFL